MAKLIRSCYAKSLSNNEYVSYEDFKEQYGEVIAYQTFKAHLHDKIKHELKGLVEAEVSGDKNDIGLGCLELVGIVSKYIKFIGDKHGVGTPYVDGEINKIEQFSNFEDLVLLLD